MATKNDVDVPKTIKEYLGLEEEINSYKKNPTKSNFFAMLRRKAAKEQRELGKTLKGLGFNLSNLHASV